MMGGCFASHLVMYDPLSIIPCQFLFLPVLNRFVEWEDFADHAMVHNPKGGTSVLPKMIIEKAKLDGVALKKNKNGALKKK